MFISNFSNNIFQFPYPGGVHLENIEIKLLVARSMTTDLSSINLTSNYNRCCPCFY